MALALHRFNREFARMALLVSLAGLYGTACSDAVEPPPEPAADDTPVLNCGEDGELATALHGAVRLDIRWQAAELTCAGMPRPNGEGARLRFAGEAEGRPIAIIISMPGFDRDAAESEYPSTVTLIEEGSARFFNSPDIGNCWTEIGRLEPIDGEDDAFVIGGGLYCVSPLAELNGDASVTLSEMQFTGLLDWNAK